LESLAILQQSRCILKGRQRLIVVSLSRRNRRMTEKIADLRQRNAALGQTRGVFMPQIVPSQILDPRARQRLLPRLPEETDRLASGIAEHRGRVWFVLPIGIEMQEL